MSQYIEGKTGLWEVVIGLEVHAQVSSISKLFSGAATAFGAEPNTQVSFIDAGMPGMLPVINGFCIDQAIKTGLGLQGTINALSVFDRKNYFYADLPQGYQISQFHRPLVTGGHVDIEVDGETKRIQITRLHVEQDAGKSIHDLHPTKSYIDLNRVGIALMEIVSEPDMRSAAEAMAFFKALRTLLRYLDTCDGNMDQGSMRADANVSLRRPQAPFGTRAEIKNLNSIRFLGQAITYEIERQMDILESGGTIVQETRLFDTTQGVTRSMRSKEEAHDYRYFPDPDLPPLRLTEERIQVIRLSMPELPEAKKQRFIKDFGLSPYDASILVAEKETAAYYERAVAGSQNPTQAAKLIANWLAGDVFALMNRDNLSIETMPLPPTHVAELVDLILNGTISGKIAKDVFVKMWDTGQSPAALVDQLGLQQVSDTGLIERVIDDILMSEPDKVQQYREGKVQLFGYFVGCVMKAMQGKANPACVNDILKAKLN